MGRKSAVRLALGAAEKRNLHLGVERFLHGNGSYTSGTAVILVALPIR